MERGLTRVVEVLAVLALLLLSAPYAMSPVVRAQSGQWVVTTSLQAGLSIGVASVTISGSGSATLNVDGQGRITGTGTFQGSATVTASTGCSGGGTIPFSESETYSGHVANTATGNATITVTASGSTAPTSITVTCPNSNPPPATISYSVPIPSQLGTGAGTFSVMLTDGYTYSYNFPAPLTGSFSMRVRGGAATTTTSSSTSQANGSLGLTVPLGKVQICDSGFNNCKLVKGGETLQPGQCITTASASGVSALNANMEVSIGENSVFCLPATRTEISALCTMSQTYGTIQGQLHVGTWGLGLGQNIYIITPYGAVCDTGTEFVVRTSDNGTTVMVLSGTVLVADPTSKSTVTLGSGQTISVQSSPSGMGQMEMQQAVHSFDPASVDKWWLSQGTQTTSSTSGGVMLGDTLNLAIAAGAALLLLAVVSLAMSRSRSRRRLPPPPSP